MALDLWFREDVTRVLAATQETLTGSLNAVSAACPQEAAAYERGFSDALRAVGVAFGIVLPTSLAGSDYSSAHRIPGARAFPVGHPGDPGDYLNGG